MTPTKPASASGKPAPSHPSALRLRAEDDEDLAILSSVVQDALVPVADICHLKDQRRLALLVNRFCWECACPEHSRPDQRVLCSLVFENVTSVRQRGIDCGRRRHLLEILAVRLAGPGEVEIDFAGDQTLRLTVDGLKVRLEDVEEPYPTSWRPQHKLDDPSPRAP